MDRLTKLTRMKNARVNDAIKYFFFFFTLFFVFFFTHSLMLFARATSSFFLFIRLVHVKKMLDCENSHFVHFTESLRFLLVFVPLFLFY